MIHRLIGGSISCFILATLLQAAGSGENYATWPYSERILLNTSATGANIPRNVVKVPVLLRLDPGNFNFFSQVLDSGKDIRFSKTDGTHLPYQISRWKDGAGNNDTAEIWVRVDTVYGGNYSQSFLMYWGKAGAADSSKGSAVFDTANGFVGVWHLDENPSAAAASIKDATANALHATSKGGMSNTNLVAGMIGNAHNFDGIDDADSIPFKSVLNFANAVTLSAWVRVSAFQSYSRIISRGITTDVNPWTIYSLNTHDTTSRLRGEVSKGDSGSQKFVLGQSNMSTNTWYHIAMTYDRANLKIYRNGIQDSISSAATDLIGTTQTTPLMIGKSNYSTNPFKGIIDEARVEKVARDSNWLKFCYENQRQNQTLITTGGEFRWDTSADTGYQPGSGIWGKDNFWTRNGTQLVSWPGRGYWAMITGGVDGNYTITVDGTQYLDSLVVRRNTFIIKDGTLNFGVKSAIHIPNTITTTIASVIDGSGGVSKWGRGTLVLSGANTYTGPTRILAGTLSTGVLADGGSNSGIGRSSNSSGNLMIDSGVFVYTGGAITCDRLFSVGLRGGTITASGSGALNLNNTGSMGFLISGTRTLTLDGTNTGDNTIAAVIGDSGGITSVIKQGTGKWILAGACKYTGATTVSSGTLFVNGSLDSASAVTVAAGATIGGSGNIAGAVTAAGAVILPGNSGPGKLRFGSLVLDRSSRIEIELGTVSDTIAVARNLTLDGTINITATTGFGTGKYRIITYGGTLKNDTLSVGDLMAGRKCTFEYGTGYVDAVISSRIIQSSPADTVLLVGQRAEFKVSVVGTPPFSYLWQRFPDDTVGKDSTFSITAVTRDDNGSRYRCIVTDAFESDTSRWALLTVLDTPRVTMQPQKKTVSVGEKALFTFTVADTTRCSYAWRKIGSATVLATTLSYSIAAVTASDEGDYYCLITNPVATVSTDTVRLTVLPPPPEAYFGYSPRTGAAPLEVSFFDSSIGDITSRRWDFGDGKSDTAANPKHIYTIADTYTVTLKVTGRGGVDSIVKKNAIVVFDTLPRDTSLQKALRLTSLTYDSMTASIHVSWCIDSARFADDIEVGIAYSLVAPPSAMRGRQIVAMFTSCIDTTVNLFEPLRFDTLYHVALFARAHGKGWPAPTDAARGTVRTRSPYRQIVTIFDTAAHGDTVRAFNDRIMLWRDTGQSAAMFTIDTLEIYRFTPPAGFTVAGTPFLFVNAGPVLPFFVGISIRDLPAGEPKSKVRLYRDSAGVIFVDYSSVVDTVAGVVYVNTRDLKLPFIAMIDKQPPKVTFLRRPDSVAYAEKDLVDSVKISDNIANVRWTYLCSRGDETPAAYGRRILNDTSVVERLVISGNSQIISSESGVRALFVVDDAVNRDTLNLSRPVYRVKSDAMTTSGQIWHPVYPTARLFNPDPESLIIATINKETGYDTRYLRLFRWVETAENRANDTNKWVEYAPDDQIVRSLFTMTPGKLVWLKTRNNALLHLGSGLTLSPKDTFSIELPAGQFTDFGMPFRFGVNIRDILAASNRHADSIQFYVWTRDTATNRYGLDLLYHPLMADKKDPSAKLEYKYPGGYSLFNPCNTTVVLRIPPTLAGVAVESIGPAKRVKEQLWGALLIATTSEGFDLPALYCGYAPGIKICAAPVAPTFHSLRMFVFDRETGKKHGYYIAEEAARGMAKELLITNTSDSIERISYRFQSAGEFPETFSASLYDAATGRFSGSGSMTVEPQSAISRWIIVGDEKWYDDFRASVRRFTYGLEHPYPNPARSFVNFRYTVPFGAQGWVSITIFDLRGRMVWEEKRSASQLAPGRHCITWDGCNRHHTTVSAGRYPVRLAVMDSSGRIVQRFDRFLTYIP